MTLLANKFRRARFSFREPEHSRRNGHREREKGFGWLLEKGRANKHREKWIAVDGFGR